MMLMMSEKKYKRRSILWNLCFERENYLSRATDCFLFL